MTTYRKYLPLAILISLFTLLGAFFVFPPKFGFQGVEIDNAQLIERLHKKKPTLVYAFSTWCTSCKKNHGILSFPKVKDQYHIVGLPIDDSPDRVAYFMEKNPNIFDVVIEDRQHAIQEQLQIVGIPETFIIAPNKVIVYTRRGELILNEILDVASR